MNPPHPMTDRQRALAILGYRGADRLPIVHFGFWNPETLRAWEAQGHVSAVEASGWSDGNAVDLELTRRLGFDFNWAGNFGPACDLFPAFSPRVVRSLPDGSEHVLNAEGVVVLWMPGTLSIPPEIEHTLVARADWETHYLPRLQWDPRRVTEAWVRTADGFVTYGDGGLDALRREDRSFVYGFYCGSLIGKIRNWVGVENLAYLPQDDPALLDEMVATVADLSFRAVERVLQDGARFDYIHFWEDICFRSGPLVNPEWFGERLVPHYRRITDLARSHGIGFASVDCDGCIDTLVPHWLAGGVNAMFPIEVGTWHASIAPWRGRFGRELRGIGGVDKRVFARDRAAVDAEIERLKPLVALGGYLPCPDHRFPPESQWDLIRYYTDRMRTTFGGPL